MSVVTPNVNDVLFGRGAALNVHPGNKQFRSLVDSQRKDIANAKDRKQKRAIATLIYNAVLELHPPGRFLVQDQRLISPELNYASAAHSGSDVHPTLAKRTWVYVEPEKALAKILHRMRERDKEVEKEGGTQPERAVWDIYAQKSQLPSPAHQEPEDEKGDECNVEESDSQGVHSSSLLESIYLDDIQNQTAHQILSSAEDSKLQLDSDPSHQLREYTCRQWITSTKPEIDATSMQSSTEMTKYVKSALLVALKLTECIQEAEKDERRGHRNPIPLASIAPENLLIRTRQVQPPVGESTEAEETIEFAWMMSFVGDDSATGTVMSRLFSLGTVLYELFSMNEFIMDEDEMQPYHNMDSINISNDTESDYHTQKKIHRRSTQVDDEISHCVARLESNVVSWSLCALVKNLLECRHDPFCEDDAYASFEDLHADLQLMVDNPSCFLDNIHLSNNPKLEIPDKLYGRGEELSKLDDLFKRHIMGKVLSGAILSGEAGVGKSKLALYLQEQTYHCNGYFLSAKFEQHQMSLKPMSTIASMFDSLCELVFNDSSHSLLMEIDGELTSAIGTQPYLLGFIPNLRKLMPSCGRLETSNNCVDSAVSLRYLLGELLRVISSHSNLITIVIDDIQFADYASLLLVRNLLFSAKRTPVFFTLCHRDDESSMSVKFNAWLTSITMLALEPIKLESVTPRDVNQLVSEALHLSPRLTRSLSSVLHHKTRGNPLFLRQLLDSLTEQGYIYIDLKQHRWTWNLDAIVELEISESVIALLTDDIKRLPSDLQFGLQVAACIGSYVSESPLKYLSIDLGLDLKDILQQASQKGFMIDVADSTMFRFAHDKIQEAVYELMPDQQRRENHMRFGLGLCTQTLENKVDDEELFFAAVNQINQGGPTAVHDPSQKIVFAELNLQAGRRSIELSDYNTAVILFQHGISFLGDDAWKTNYQLTLELHDAAAESALNIHKLSMVSLYADCVVLNARCIDDKLLCLCHASKILALEYRVDDSIASSRAILLQFGECLPRAMGDSNLGTDIDRMIRILQSTSDNTICNMQENNDKKMTTLFVLYEYLSHVAHWRQPWLLGSLSLRMVELTIKNGLNAMSPLSFAYFGGVLSSLGYVNEGCRLGKLSLKLVERRGFLRYKARVVYFVYNTILWASEPIQMLVEAHLLGYKTGQLCGDIHYSLCNLMTAMLSGYVAGQHLDTFRKHILEFISKLQFHGMKICFNFPLLLLSQVSVLKEGLHMSSVSHVDNMPCEGEILADARAGLAVYAHGKLHHLARAYLFRKLEDATLNIDISGAIAESHHQLDPVFLFGYLFEGLTSFLLARQTSDSVESAKWIERGHAVMTKIRFWNEHSSWNWENKMLLLDAEHMFTIGEHDKAEPLYRCAIRSSREHKFVHEEAIASEHAGTFYYERGLHQTSYSCFVHSMQCFEKWGAYAVATRVGNDIKGYFGSNDIDLLESGVDAQLEYLLAPPPTTQGYEKKRQHGV